MDKINWIKMAAACLASKQTRNCLPHLLYRFALLPAVHEGSFTPTCSLASGIFSVLSGNDCNRCIVISHAFNLHFSNDIWYGVTFHVLICYIYSLVKHLFRYFAHFSIGFSYCWFKIITIFYISLLSDNICKSMPFHR